MLGEEAKSTDNVGGVDGIGVQLMKNHAWSTDHGLITLLSTEDEVEHLVISDADIRGALSGLTLRAKVRVTAKLRESLNRSR